MKRNLLGSLALAGLMLLPSLSLSAQDDAASQSVGLLKLTAGEVFNNTFEGQVTTHLYWFNGSAGDKVTLSMTQTDDESGLDPFLVLLGSAGQVIASDDDSGTEALFSARIEGAELPADGGYMVVASSFQYIDAILPESEGVTSLEAPQAYTLLVEGFNEPVNMPDYNPDELVYFASQIEYNQPFEGASTPEEPVYYITFLATEGDVIDISLESDEFDTLLYLFGANGERLAVSDDSGASSNSAITGFSIPATGKYMLFATDFAFYEASKPADEVTFGFTGGNFRLTITSATVG